MIFIKFALIQMICSGFLYLLYKYTKLKNTMEYSSFKKVIFPISFAVAYLIIGMLQFI